MTPKVTRQLVSLLTFGLLITLTGSAPGIDPPTPATFTVPADLRFDLLLSEPAVRQPVHLSFDERGRLWVVQYLQYPEPAGLKHHTLLTSDDLRGKYRELLGVVKEEYENIVKNEVQRAIAADEDALKRLCGNYIDNVKAYTQREKVKNSFTGQYQEPDERLMRSIEQKIDIPESRKDDFRREIMNYIGALSIDGRTFDYKTNERLYKALELKLFEDQKDSIKLTSLVSKVVDADTQAKIDVVKHRLIRDYGYDEESASDVLNYVASIFARGDAKPTQ